MKVPFVLAFGLIEMNKWWNKSKKAGQTWAQNIERRLDRLAESG